jgi:methyl-accepting chemotaxis protein
VVRPQFLARVLADLHAIANVARAAPHAARVAAKRAERIEKRLEALQRELEETNTRLRKMGKRLDRNIDATAGVTKAVKSMNRGVERIDSGIDVVAASTQPIEPKLGMLHASVHPLAGGLRDIRNEVERLASRLERDGGAPAAPDDTARRET